MAGSCWGCSQRVAGNRHSFTANCVECQAVSIARSPVFAKAREEKKITPEYRTVLDRVFGGDWQRGHEIVKKAFEKESTGDE